MSLRSLSRISPILISGIHPSLDESQSDRGGVPPEIERGTRAVATVPDAVLPHLPGDQGHRAARLRWALRSGLGDAECSALCTPSRLIEHPPGVATESWRRELRWHPASMSLETSPSAAKLWAAGRDTSGTATARRPRADRSRGATTRRAGDAAPEPGRPFCRQTSST